MATDKVLTKNFLEMYHLLHRYHLMWYGKKFGGLDPWQGQGRILSALRKIHKITQKELGFMLDLRPQSLGELLQKLETNGYIVRYRDKEDKRALIVELTEKGATFHVQKPDYDEVFLGLTSDERKVLRVACAKIAGQLRGLIEEELEDTEYYEGQNFPTFRL